MSRPLRRHPAGSDRRFDGVLLHARLSRRVRPRPCGSCVGRRLAPPPLRHGMGSRSRGLVRCARGLRRRVDRLRPRGRFDGRGCCGRGARAWRARRTAATRWVGDVPRPRRCGHGHGAVDVGARHARPPGRGVGADHRRVGPVGGRRRHPGALRGRGPVRVVHARRDARVARPASVGRPLLVPAARGGVLRHPRRCGPDSTAPDCAEPRGRWR